MDFLDFNTKSVIQKGKIDTLNIKIKNIFFMKDYIKGMKKILGENFGNHIFKKGVVWRTYKEL